MTLLLVCTLLKMQQGEKHLHVAPEKEEICLSHPLLVQTCTSLSLSFIMYKVSMIGIVLISCDYYGMEMR